MGDNIRRGDLGVPTKVIEKTFDEGKMIRIHCPEIPIGKEKVAFGRAVLCNVNCDYGNLLPQLVRSFDYGFIASSVTTALCLKWLYAPNRRVYKVVEAGKLELEPGMKGIKYLQDMCK